MSDWFEQSVRNCRTANFTVRAAAVLAAGLSLPGLALPGLEASPVPHDAVFTIGAPQAAPANASEGGISERDVPKRVVPKEGNPDVFAPKRVEPAKMLPPTAATLDALRSLLSGDPRVEERGEASVRRMGGAVLPQLRYWINKVRGEARRVEFLVQELGGGTWEASHPEGLSAEVFLQRRMLEARQLSREGRHEESRRIAEAILALDPDPAEAWLLRRLVRHSRKRLAAAEVIEPSIEVDGTAFAVGEKPAVKFRLVNQQRTPVRIELAGRVLGEVEATVTRVHISGAVNRETRRVMIRVPEPDPDAEVDEADIGSIVVEPGGTWEQPLDFRLEKGLPLEGLVVRVQYAGRFRPARWDSGGNPDLENLSLEVPLTEFWFVPPSLQTDCDRPLEKLTAALVFGGLEPFFVAGCVATWAAEEDPYLNEKVIETFILHIDKLDAPRQDHVFRFLSSTTGEGFGRDVQGWKKWWAGRNPPEGTGSRSATESRSARGPRRFSGASSRNP